MIENNFCLIKNAQFYRGQLNQCNKSLKTYVLFVSFEDYVIHLGTDYIPFQGVK